MKIFISSTYEDLKEERSNLHLFLRKADFQTEGMEFFSSSPNEPIEVCLDKVRSSDFVILIVGDRFGTPEPISGKSYTQLEYKEAIEARIPILPFLKLIPKDITIDTELIDFRNQIEATATFFSDRETLIGNVLSSVFSYINEKGLVTRRIATFQTFSEFFEPFTKQSRLFNHTHKLVGRDEDINKLIGFLENENQRVCTLCGSGGAGKSKLLYEFFMRTAKEQTPYDFRFLCPQIDFSLEALKELPACEQCIVIEDAHKREDLETILNVLMHPIYKDKTKIIFSTRPSGTNKINHALSIFDPEEELPLVLEALDPKTYASELAESVLGKEYGYYKESLVKASDGNCLILTVGGNLIKNGKLSVDILENPDFRNKVLEKLLEDLETGLSVDESRIARKLLTILSGICPIIPEAKEIQDIISQEFRTEWHHLASLINKLTQRGLILRRGRKIRIIPDVLADYLLLSNAVDSNSAFIDHLFDVFGQFCFSNILRNTSEVEFSVGLKENEKTLLKGVWKDIENTVRNKDTKYSQLSDLLDKIEPSSFYAPQKVLDIIKLLIDPEILITSTRQEEGFARYINEGTILNKIPSILRVIAWHPQYTKEVVKILWELTGNYFKDKKSLAFEHPFSVITKLASLDNHNYFSIVNNTLNTVESIINSKKHVIEGFDMHEVIEATLKQDIEVNTYNRRSFSFSFTRVFTCEPKDKILEIRNRAFEILSLLAQDENPRVVLRTVQSLAEMLHVYNKGPSGDLSGEEITFLVAEAHKALSLLEAIVSKATNTVLRNIVIDKIQSPELFLMDAIVKDVNELRNKIKTEELSYKVQHCIMHDWAEFVRDEEHNETDERFQELQQKTAKVLWDEFSGDPKKVFDYIKNIIVQSNAIGYGCQGGLFQRHCAQIYPEKAPQIIDLFLKENNPHLPYSITNWFQSVPLENKYDVSRKLLKEGEPQHVRALACCISDLKDLPIKETLEIIKTLANIPDRQVKMSIAQSLCYMHKSTDEIPDELVDMLCDFDIENDSALLNHLLRNIDRKYGIPHERLSNEQVKKILSKIESVNLLGQNQYEIDQFLGYYRVSNLRDIITMSINRIEKSSRIRQEEESSEEKYQPFPYLGFSQSISPDVSSNAEFTECLNLLFKASRKEDYSFWYPKIFKWLNPIFSQISQDFFLRKAKDSNEEEIVNIAHLLKDYDRGIIFSVCPFISELLLRAKEVSEDCYKHVGSTFYCVAFSGTHYVSPPGQPDGFHLSIAEQCKILIEKESLPEPVLQFYRSVQKSADERAKEKLDRDKVELEEEEF